MVSRAIMNDRVALSVRLFFSLYPRWYMHVLHGRVRGDERLEIKDGSAGKRVNIVQHNQIVFHRQHFAHTQGDQVGADRGATGKDTRQRVRRIALGVDPQNAAFLRLVVLVEPIEHIDMGPFLQSQQAIHIRIKDADTSPFITLFHGAYGVDLV